MKSVIFKKGESAVKQDKKGNNYKQITFGGTEIQTVNVGGQEIHARLEARTTQRNRYEKSYLPSANGAMELGYGEANGTAFLGAIVTREVQTPYEIPARKDGEAPRMASTFTIPVFGDTEDAGWEAKVKAAFRSNGHPIKGDDYVAAVKVEGPAVALVPEKKD